MAKSRRAEKQKIQKDYEAFLQDEILEEERLRHEEDEFWAQKLEYEALLYERAQKEAIRSITDAFNNDFESCWTDYDPFFDECAYLY